MLPAPCSLILALAPPAPCSLILALAPPAPPPLTSPSSIPRTPSRGMISLPDELDWGGGRGVLEYPLLPLIIVGGSLPHQDHIESGVGVYIWPYWKEGG
eukprot:752593-Hanusia_phi.AAC.1